MGSARWCSNPTSFVNIFAEVTDIHAGGVLPDQVQEAWQKARPFMGPGVSRHAACLDYTRWYDGVVLTARNTNGYAREKYFYYASQPEAAAAVLDLAAVLLEHRHAIREFHAKAYADPERQGRGDLCRYSWEDDGERLPGYRRAWEDDGKRLPGHHRDLWPVFRTLLLNGYYAINAAELAAAVGP